MSNIINEPKEILTISSITKEQIEKKYKHEILSLNQNNKIKEDNKEESEEKELNKDDDTTALIAISTDKENFDKIPLNILIYYSLPSFAKMSCFVLLNIHAMLYYESIGASLVYMSFFVTMARGIEILLKPIIAHLSDELKTSIGRRKPFMIAGCGFYSIFLILLFSPPSMKTGTYNLSIWFGIFYVLFFIAETITNVPYLALGPELSSNSKQRERLYFFFYIFQYIGVLFASAAPVLLNRYFENCDCSVCLNNPLIYDIEKCIRNCKIMCNVKANQESLFTLSLSIGIFFILSIILLSLEIKEKNDSFNTDSMSFIPSLYQLIHNKPFFSLIIPWLLDVTIMNIFSTMLPFFLNIIINPQKYCIQNKIPLDALECSVNYYLGLTICIFFICCLCFCGVWHYLVSRFGKRKCWLCYSLMCTVPFSLFIFCGVGSKGLLIIAAILTAFPSGGAYLNDVLVSDTIDYDEFFTGKRNEGIFTVCSAFIPKFVSLFAQAIPLSIMGLLGFVPSENGYVHTQPKEVVNFIRIFFSVIPIGLCLISFLFKLNYPIYNDGINFLIKQSVDLQKDKIEYLKSSNVEFYKINDPVYKRSHFNIIINNDIQRETKNLADHFGNTGDLISIYNGELVYTQNKIKAIILISFVFLIGGSVTLFYSFEFLSDQKYSFIPISAVFAVAICLIVIALYSIKCKILGEAIDGKINIDKKFLKMLIYVKMKNDKHSHFKKEKKENKVQ